MGFWNRKNIRKSLTDNIEDAGSEIGDTMLALRKAMGHKYLRRWRNPKKPKEYCYLYAKDFRRPEKKLESLFGLKEKSIDNVFEKNNIQQEYGADKKTFAAHILEYLSNREKWDKVFSSNANKEKYKKPTKQSDLPAKKTKSAANSNKIPILLNRTLMCKVWQIYNTQKEPIETKEIATSREIKPRRNNQGFEKIPIGKVDRWLIDEAKEVGLDIDGFEHEITNEFVAHVMNEHGNEKKEKSRGQIAVKEGDFKKIPEIVKKPDMAIVGAKRESKDMVIYAKEMPDGTTLYFEEVLSGKDNKTLRGKTMFKRKDGLDREKVINIITNREKTDVSKAKIIVGAGSHSGGEASKNTDLTAATSAQADNSNIPQSGEMSSPEPEESEEEKRRNRSEAMKGNKNAKKDILSLVEKHRKGEITSLELKEMGIYSGMQSVDTERDFEFVKDYFNAGAVIVINNNGTFSEPIKSMEELRPLIGTGGDVCMYNTKESFDKIVDKINEGIASRKAIWEAEEKKARKKAGMPETELFDRSSAMEDSTWNPKSEDYRYKDTGYIAGSRKETAANYIKRMARDKNHVSEKDIDWQGIEENPRQAKQLITKSNIFGKVDWGTLKESGMTGSAAFLVDRVYASVGAEPKEDNAEARRRYSIAIDGLRDRFEKCKTVDEVVDTVKDIKAEMDGDFIAAKEAPEVLELSQKLSELKQKRQELEKGEEPINGLRTREETEYDRKAQAYFDQEAEKIRAKDKRKKRVSEYDFSPEVRAEYNRFREVSGEDKRRRLREYRGKNGFLEDMDITNVEGNKIGFRSRGYLYNEIKALETERDLLYSAHAAKIIMNNPIHEAWTQLGDKFNGVINYNRYGGSDTFRSHVSLARRGKFDDWEWADKKEFEVSKKGEKRRAKFELKVASKFERKGGREVKSESAGDLKNNFNLRDVQFGIWVAEDPESAKFHVDNMASGLADLSDMTGIPDGLLSMNGRLAIAFGARGVGNAGWHGAATSHYEPVERVINITKMKGGGCLAHEWLHAFDNLISESMTGGNINKFLTDPHSDLTPKQRKLKEEADYLTAQAKLTGKTYDSYIAKNAVKKAEEAGIKFPEQGSEEEHIQKVKTAFSNLVKVMTEGTTPMTSTVRYTEKDYNKAMLNFGANASRFGRSIKDAGSLEKAIEIINSASLKENNKKEWVLITTAYYDGKPIGNTVKVPNGRQGSSFYKYAMDLDADGVKSYYSQRKEMAARAFSAYVDDKLRKNGRQNDYLAYATTNDYYVDPIWGNTYPYPEGEERERINSAFEELFKIVNETGAIRKALNMGDKKMFLFMKKSAVKEFNEGEKLRYFKKKIIEHLNSLEKSEKEGIAVMNKARGLPVGTVRDWQGQKYKKVAPNKWKPMYDSQSRGAKSALSAIKRKINLAETPREILEIINDNRERFSGENIEPIIGELLEYAGKGIQRTEAYRKKRQEIDQKKWREDQRKAQARNPIERRNKRMHEMFENARASGNSDPEYQAQYKKAVDDNGGTNPGGWGSKEHYEQWKKESEGENQKEKSNYANVSSLKDDYAAGKVDFDTAMKEYMALLPKADKDLAHGDISMWKHPKITGNWENPLEKYGNIEPERIARTMADMNNMRSARVPETREKMINALVDRWKVSKEDAEKFVDRCAYLPETDRLKAKKYTDTIDKKKQIDRKKKQETEKINNDYKNTASNNLMERNFNLLESYVNKEISSDEFHQKLVDMGYNSEDRLEIKQFAGTLKPVDWDKHLKDLKEKQEPKKLSSFDPSKLIKTDSYGGRDAFLKENPEYVGANIGFYLPKYESKLNQAAEDYAVSVMDKKPKREYSLGSVIFHGTINGQEAYITTTEEHRTRYIKIVFKETYKKPEKGTKTKAWENPLAKYKNIDPLIVARTMKMDYGEAVKDPKTIQRMVESIEERGVSKKDAEAFVKIVSGLTEKDRKAAEKYVDRAEREEDYKVDKNKKAEKEQLNFSNGEKLTRVDPLTIGKTEPVKFLEYTDDKKTHARVRFFDGMEMITDVRRLSKNNSRANAVIKKAFASGKKLVFKKRRKVARAN